MDQKANSEKSTSFKLLIVSPDRIVLETVAIKMMAPTITQELAILPDHTPLYSELVKGKLIITLEDGKEKEVEVEGGILRVRSNKVSVVLGFEPEIERRSGK